MAFFATQDLIEWKHAEMSAGRLVVYWAVTVTAVLMGVPLDIAASTAP